MESAPKTNDDPSSEIGMPEEMGHAYEDSFNDIKPHISEEELFELCSSNETLEELLTDMLDYAQRYVRDVWNMQTMLENKDQYETESIWADEFSTADSNRTRLHDTFVDSIAILSRNMAKNGISNEWVRELAPTGSLERSACGKFAIMLMFQRYINYKLSIGENYD